MGSSGSAGSNTWKNAANSDIGQIAIPIIAGMYSGGLASGGLATGGAVAGSQATAVSGVSTTAVAAGAGQHVASTAIAPGIPDMIMPDVVDQAPKEVDPNILALRRQRMLAASYGRGSTILADNTSSGKLGDSSGGKTALGG